VESVQHCLGQRDLAPQRGMHRVLKELIVQETVTTNRPKVRLPVDQDAPVPRGHVTVNLLKGGRAAHRIAVQIAGRNVMAVSFIPGGGPLEKLGQAIVRLGEAGLKGEEQSVSVHAVRGIVCLEPACVQKRASIGFALVARHARQKKRAVWLEVRIVGRRQDENRQRPHPLRIGYHLLQPTPEIGQQRCVFERCVYRHVDQASPVRRGRQRKATLVSRLADQAAKMRKTLRPIDHPIPRARDLVGEIIRLVIGGEEARLELVVAAVNDQYFGAPTQVDERLVLFLEGITRPGQNLKSDRSSGDGLPELPGDDLADR